MVVWGSVFGHMAKQILLFMNFSKNDDSFFVYDIILTSL